MLSIQSWNARDHIRDCEAGQFFAGGASDPNRQILNIRSTETGVCKNVPQPLREHRPYQSVRKHVVGHSIPLLLSRPQAGFGVPICDGSAIFNIEPVATEQLFFGGHEEIWHAIVVARD